MKYPLTIIHHGNREKLGINLIDYALLEYIVTNSRFGSVDVTNSFVAEALGVNSKQVAASLRRLEEENMVEYTPDGIKTTKSCLSVMAMDIDDEDIGNRMEELGSYFLRRLAEIAKEFRCSYISPPHHTHKASIKSVARKLKTISRKHNITEKDLDLIISWAIKQWGFNPDMRDYVRASTLLGSANKYEKYKEIAQQFWRSQINVSSKVH